MTRGPLRTLAALAAASLLLTACGGDDTPAAAPSAHPVLDRQLDLQLLMALRQTQKAGNASFRQTLTFTSKQGTLVQTLRGRMDFAGGRGETDVTWTIPAGAREDTRTVLLGDTPGRGPGASSARYLVDAGQIHYRAATSDYWIRYGVADTPPTGDHEPIDHLRGIEAPIGGTLLEGIGAATATARSDGPTEHTYRATMPADTLWQLVPSDMRGELDIESNSSVGGKSVPLTVTVDAQGRVTHGRADLTRALRKNSVFGDFTALTMDLDLSGYGTSKPATAPTGTVRAETRSVLPMRDVANGKCVDFDSGQRLAHLVVDVPCSGPYDARVFVQLPLDGTTDQADTQERADIACRIALDMARPAWIPKGAEIWGWWTPRPRYKPGKDLVTCYVTTERGDA